MKTIGKYDRKTVWQSHLGNLVSVEGIDDEHLANVIQYLSHYKGNDKLLKVFKEEAKLCGLTKEFLEKAQYPYKDGLGNYLVWDFEINAARSIGSYVRGSK